MSEAFFISISPNSGSGRALRGRTTNTRKVMEAMTLPNAQVIFDALCSWVTVTDFLAEGEKVIEVVNNIIPSNERGCWRVTQNINSLSPLSFVPGEVIIIDGATPERFRKPNQLENILSPTRLENIMPPPGLPAILPNFCMPIAYPFFAPALPLISRLV